MKIQQFSFSRPNFFYSSLLSIGNYFLNCTYLKRRAICIVGVPALQNTRSKCKLDSYSQRLFANSLGGVILDSTTHNNAPCATTTVCFAGRGMCTLRNGGYTHNSCPRQCPRNVWWYGSGIAGSSHSNTSGSLGKSYTRTKRASAFVLVLS
jgi:hypothetical protein